MSKDNHVKVLANVPDTSGPEPNDVKLVLVQTKEVCVKCSYKENETETVGINMVTWNDDDYLEDGVFMCGCGMIFKIVDEVKHDLGMFRD